MLLEDSQQTIIDPLPEHRKDIRQFLKYVEGLGIKINYSSLHHSIPSTMYKNSSSGSGNLDKQALMQGTSLMPQQVSFDERSPHMMTSKTHNINTDTKFQIILLSKRNQEEASKQFDNLISSLQLPTQRVDSRPKLEDFVAEPANNNMNSPVQMIFVEDN